MPGKKGKTKRNKDVIVEITPKDYEESIAQGANPEFALKPGKHVFRRISS